MIKEVEELIEYANNQRHCLLKHKDDNGEISTCCNAADIILKHSVLAASFERKSIVDVLRYLELNFSWGVDYCSYLCECLNHKDSIDCISMTHLSIYALEHALEVCEGNFETAIVDIVLRSSIEDSTHWKRKSNGDVWMRDGYLYHQCLGLINKDSQTLTLHDPSQEGDIYSYQNQNLDIEGAILAIRCKPKSMNSCFWDGKKELKYDEWQRICNESSSPKNSFSDLTLFVTGVAGSSTNPCAGIGVARSLRSHPLLIISNIIAIDKCYFYSNALDPVFSSCITIDYFGSADSIQEQFEAIVNLLITHKNSCYIPCRDFDVNVAALGKYLLLNNGKASDEKLNIDFINDKSDEYLYDLASKLLCPEYPFLEQLEKPNFKILTTMNYPFVVPTCLSIDTSTSLYEIQSFAEKIGYPCVIKGKQQGCVICYSFFDIRKAVDQPWCKNGFIQQHITGTEKGVVLASVNGELTGAMIMTKTAITPEGKVWMGNISALESTDQLMSALINFCKESNWTGGCEVEYIEDLSGVKYLIDINPRFPAWVFATTYSGLNLVGEFVLHHQNKDNYKPVPSDDVKTSKFVRSTIELPQNNFITSRRFHFADNAIVTSEKGKKQQLNVTSKGFGEQARNQNKTPMISLHRNASISGEFSIDAILNLLCESLNAMPTAGQNTPVRVVSIPVVEEALNQQKLLFTSMADTIMNTLNLSTPLSIQLFISVKTQPHKAILSAAKDKGYYAECISLAEYATALTLWEPKEICLTGPAKFWQGVNIIESPIILHSIFADSMPDLDNILHRIENNEIHVGIVGVRWCLAKSSTSIISRFGFDCNNPTTIAKVLETLKNLPIDTKIGMHFHFASSNIGLNSWFSQAKSFVIFCADFGKALGRSISVLDLGGGFNVAALNENMQQGNLNSLFQLIYNTYVGNLPTVQFELGKCISEMSGVVFTRIIMIRETNEWVRKDQEKPNRAIIVDTSISEISSPHLHPIYWRDQGKWVLLSRGHDILWGRTCMEFDTHPGVDLPDLAKIGDLLMITACGAYDSSMQYDFGDGKGRDICIVR